MPARRRPRLRPPSCGPRCALRHLGGTSVERALGDEALELGRARRREVLARRGRVDARARRRRPGRDLRHRAAARALLRRDGAYDRAQLRALVWLCATAASASGLCPRRRKPLTWAAMRRWVLAAGATALIGLPDGAGVLLGGLLRRAAHHRRARRLGARGRWPRSSRRGRCPVSTAGRLALAGLALLCAWTALSITWAPHRRAGRRTTCSGCCSTWAFSPPRRAAARARRAARARARAGAGRVRGRRLRAVRAPVARRHRPRSERLLGRPARAAAHLLERLRASWPPSGFVLAVRVAGDPRAAARCASLLAAARGGARPRRVPELRARRPRRRRGRPAGAGGPRARRRGRSCAAS